MPGLIIFLGALLLSLVLIKPQVVLYDQGTGRHLAMGRAIWANTSIPVADPLSFTYADRPYLDFEWLFDITSYYILVTYGLPFLIFVTFLIYSASVTLFTFHLLRQRIQVFTCLSFGFLLSIANYVHLLTRPVIFTYLFLILIIIAWNNWLKKRRPRLSFALILTIFIIWTNIHPGFASGLVYIALASLGYLLDNHKQHWPKLRKQIRRIFIAGVLCGLVTLLNPYFIRLHEKILYLVFKSKTLGLLEESLPPDFTDPNGATLFFMIYLISLPFILISKRYRYSELIPMLAMTYFAFKSQRHILLLAPIALLPMARTLDYYLKRLLPSRLLKKIDQFTLLEKKAKKQWLWGTGLALAIGISFLSISSQKNLRIGVSNFHPAAKVFIDSNKANFQRPIISSVLAGNILYYFHPTIKVPFDDRVDFYGDKISYQFLDAFSAKPGTENFLNNYDFDSAILHRGEPLERLLKTLPEWTVCYEDKNVIIFTR
ncbi:MAG: hypothetical protein AAGA64_15680 [Bacteroidota bacterium]